MNLKNKECFVIILGKEVLPLLLLHGWPGSVREFYEFIPLLTDPLSSYDFVFEVVAPSIPGYGFSEAASRPGLGPGEIGSIFNDLMLRLGFKKYYIQGGDWGSGIGGSMSITHAENVLGFHSNFCTVLSLTGQLQALIASFFPSFFIEKHKQSEYSSRLSLILEESGYFHIQATKPDTIGVGLTDSPAGLAAYILEKFSTGTNKNWRELADGGLKYYSTSALLDNVMLYWITNSITTSVRLYAEAVSRGNNFLKIQQIPIKRPTACARFNHELNFYSSALLHQHYKDLVQITDFPRGGHFAAFEVPELLADDVWTFVNTVRSRHLTS